MEIDYYSFKNIYLKLYLKEDKLSKIEFIKTEKNSLNNQKFDKIKKELIRYFNGELKKFSINLDLEGTDFQKTVWNELLKIPYGKVMTYKDIATLIGKPKASRAVGMACNKNKIPIIIPCHRVVGKKGLTGYAGGIDLKRELLKLENIKEDT